MYLGHVLQTHSVTKTVSPHCDGEVEVDLGEKKTKNKPTKTHHLAPSLKDPFPLAYICPCYWH